ncbi:MAG TPA: hypothetical protein VG104_10310 [Candidatus Dormibacteraeota bacterium]|nr:hypothetical protein [Candidatus Dormibacteraeota bacterium]
MPVFPVRPDAEEPYGLHLHEFDLVIGELAGAGELPREAGFAGALRAGTAPAQQLEIVGRLVTVRPLNRQ